MFQALLRLTLPGGVKAWQAAAVGLYYQKANIQGEPVGQKIEITLGDPPKGDIRVIPAIEAAGYPLTTNQLVAMGQQRLRLMPQSAGQWASIAASLAGAGYRPVHQLGTALTLPFRRGAPPRLTGLEGVPTLAEMLADFVAGARVPVASAFPPPWRPNPLLQAAAGLTSWVASQVWGLLNRPPAMVIPPSWEGIGQVTKTWDIPGTVTVSWVLENDWIYDTTCGQTGFGPIGRSDTETGTLSFAGVDGLRWGVASGTPIIGCTGPGFPGMSGYFEYRQGGTWKQGAIGVYSGGAGASPDIKLRGSGGWRMWFSSVTYENAPAPPPPVPAASPAPGRQPFAVPVPTDLVPYDAPDLTVPVVPPSVAPTRVLPPAPDTTPGSQPATRPATVPLGPPWIPAAPPATTPGTPSPNYPPAVPRVVPAAPPPLIPAPSVPSTPTPRPTTPGTPAPATPGTPQPATPTTPATPATPNPPTVPQIPPSPTPTTPNGNVAQPVPQPTPATPNAQVLPWPGAKPIDPIPLAPPATLDGIARKTGELEGKLDQIGGMLQPKDPGFDWEDLFEQAQRLWEWLNSIDPEGGYEISSPCVPESEPGSASQPLTAAWGFTTGPQAQVLKRLDALAELLQHHKNLKQPSCKNPSPVGEVVTVQFEET